MYPESFPLIRISGRRVVQRGEDFVSLVKGLEAISLPGSRVPGRSKMGCNCEMIKRFCRYCRETRLKDVDLEMCWLIELVSCQIRPTTQALWFYSMLHT